MLENDHLLPSAAKSSRIYLEEERHVEVVNAEFRRNPGVAVAAWENHILIMGTIEHGDVEGFLDYVDIRIAYLEIYFPI